MLKAAQSSREAWSVIAKLSALSNLLTERQHGSARERILRQRAELDLSTTELEEISELARGVELFDLDVWQRSISGYSFDDVYS